MFPKGMTLKNVRLCWLMAVFPKKGGGLKDTEFLKGPLKTCRDSGSAASSVPARARISVCMKERDPENPSSRKKPQTFRSVSISLKEDTAGRHGSVGIKETQLDRYRSGPSTCPKAGQSNGVGCFQSDICSTCYTFKGPARIETSPFPQCFAISQTSKTFLTLRHHYFCCL